MKKNREIKKIPELTVQQIGIDGGCGLIEINGVKASCIWSNGELWDHVSVCPYDGVMFDWNEMCRIKDMFFYDGEYAIQIHPPKSEYVNNVNNCLHLWRYQGKWSMPPSWMIGIPGLELGNE